MRYRKPVFPAAAAALQYCALVVMMAAAMPFPVSAAGTQSTDREQAQSRLDQVSKKIESLKARLESSRVEQKNEQGRLKQADLAIQQATLDFRQLEQQRLEHMEGLASLEKQRERYLSSLDEHMGHLAEQIRASYRMGGQSRMKLVLNQDDPAQLGRLLAYYDYLNRAQAEKISGLREALATLDQMQMSIDRELLGIEQVQSEQKQVLDQLNVQREERKELLAQLSNQIDSEESRLRELERNRKDLELLIEQLADVLADIPADLGNRTGVAQQKGHLLFPVKGPVRHAFGQQRTGGLKWQGWLIGAESGAEVRAVAYGRVAFADWLRGYGLLLIIDHGQGYLSLYAHNESLLREAGAWVEAGEIISIVGSNPGSGQGLYFELRKNGAAVDPAAWLAR